LFVLFNPCTFCPSFSSPAFSYPAFSVTHGVSAGGTYSPPQTFLLDLSGEGNVEKGGGKRKKRKGKGGIEKGGVALAPRKKFPRAPTL